MRQRLESSVAGIAVALALCAGGAIVGVAGAVPGTAAQVGAASPVSAELAAVRSLAVTASVRPTITVAAVGDLCFDSSVRRLIARSGAKAPFTSTRSVLSRADVTVGNLECALSNLGRPVAGKTFTFEGPPSAINGLTWAGFDLLALGNNHARDYGARALLDTVDRLDDKGIKHAGAGAGVKSAFRATYVKRGGATIAFLSYSQIGPSSFKAKKGRAGTAYSQHLETAEKAIRAAHKKADYVIVSYHWGVEKRFTPTSQQVRFGRASVRAGADLVLSHHPHVIEGVEFYRKGLIAYSLGNFVFSPGSDVGHDTMVLTLSLGPKGVTNVIARPAHIDPYGRPVWAKGKTRTRILSVIKRTSRGRGTRVTVKDGNARLRP
ncbi:MAG: CapA family protein [Coriobacteriia bacterium]|nr:CapA family protein [Coriobacteriia bacterium]